MTFNFSRLLHNKTIFLCVCLWCCSWCLLAQQEVGDDVESDFTSQLWFDFDPSWQLAAHQKVRGNFGYRTINPKSWHRVIFKGTFERDYDKLLFKRFKHKETLLFGNAFFILTKKDDYGSFEIRPYQGYSMSFNLTNRIVLGQTVRVEERFIFSGNPDNKVFGMRLRYQVKAVINLEGLWFGEDEGFYVPIAVEGFFNLVRASEFNDVIRVTPGLGYQFNAGFKIEGSLAYHYSKEELDKLTRTNDIVFRFRIIKTIK